MQRTKYSEGFEKFWRVWTKLTYRWQGKKTAFKYWRRDKLDSETDNLITTIQNQYNRKTSAYAGWQPEWPYLQKWLNEGRYED